MNFEIILLLSYFLGGIENIAAQNLVSLIELADDTPEKKEQVKYAYEKLLKQVNYRLRLEEGARIEVEKQTDAYQEQTETMFKRDAPPTEKENLKLWKKVNKAVDHYLKIKGRFEHEKFCEPLMSPKICKRAFKNSYFKKEKLTYTETQPDSGNDCPRVKYILWKDDTQTAVKFAMKLKMCSAMRENADNTKSLVRVYLQSAYKQPWIGKWYFFVRFPFIQNSANGRWERTSDPTILPENLSFRNEAYLSFKWF